jgi:hypothetical protein
MSFNYPKRLQWNIFSRLFNRYWTLFKKNFSGLIMEVNAGSSKDDKDEECNAKDGVFLS